MAIHEELLRQLHNLNVIVKEAVSPNAAKLIADAETRIRTLALELDAAKQGAISLQQERDSLNAELASINAGYQFAIERRAEAESSLAQARQEHNSFQSDYRLNSMATTHEGAAGHFNSLIEQLAPDVTDEMMEAMRLSDRVFHSMDGARLHKACRAVLLHIAYNSTSASTGQRFDAVADKALRASSTLIYPVGQPCRGFVPGSDPERCVYCNVKIADHPAGQREAVGYLTPKGVEELGWKEKNLGVIAIANKDKKHTIPFYLHPASPYTAREALEKLRGAMKFILAFYEPGQRHLDTNAWKVAEAGARAAMIQADQALAADPWRDETETHEAVLGDRQFMAGMKLGWNCGVTGDRKQYDLAIENRMREIAALKSSPSDGGK